MGWMSLMNPNVMELKKQTPSPAGEGWGEEIKSNLLTPPLIPTFSSREKGLNRLFTKDF
jgi:hypothetical protein